MSKCWYCNNELTTGDSPKHFGICNKCYDEMFKSGDAIIRSLTNKISDLEAKLAEKDEQLEYFSKRDDEQEKQLKKQALFHRKSIKKLRQQLTITEKALKLACERVKYFEEMQDREMGHFELFGYDSNYDLQAIIEQYKQQALTHQHEDKGE